MASSGPERSITSKSYLPQWMKSKITDSYDLEKTMAFSPPNDDDGFFLFKYKYHEDSQPHIPKPKLLEPKFTPKLQTCSELSTISPPTTLKQFSSSEQRDQPLNKINISSVAAVDGKDEHGSFAASSVVAVAHKMIGVEKKTPENTLAVPPQMRVRRNSKSLPASPQTSPKMFRKNPFFTNIFFSSNELLNSASSDNSVARAVSTEDTRITYDSWSSRVVRATSECYSPPANGFGSSVDSQNNKILKAKPSELREMNFWSPTSM